LFISLFIFSLLGIHFTFLCGLKTPNADSQIDGLGETLSRSLDSQDTLYIVHRYVHLGTRREHYIIVALAAWLNRNWNWYWNWNWNWNWNGIEWSASQEFRNIVY